MFKLFDLPAQRLGRGGAAPCDAALSLSHRQVVSVTDYANTTLHGSPSSATIYL
jgi:hypothetical protein